MDKQLRKQKEKFIKKYLLKLDQEKKFLVQLPEEMLNDVETMKRLGTMTYKDIEVEKVEYHEQYETYVYEVCVHGLLRFGFLERKDGTMQYDQLTMKE